MEKRTEELLLFENEDPPSRNSINNTDDNEYRSVETITNSIVAKVLLKGANRSVSSLEKTKQSG